MLRFTLLALFLLAGCSAPPQSHGEHVHPSAPPSSSSAVAGGFSETDAAYVQLAIPQDETVMPVLALAKAREGVDPGLVALVGEVEVGHQKELERLRSALSAAGQTYLKMHEGHDMPGMVTADELAGLTALSGTASAV